MYRLEFYEGDRYVPFLTGEAPFQPQEGDFVNIRHVTYIVTGRSFTVDRSGEVDQVIRCNIILERRSPAREIA